jgi:23S rRNA pseudouridine2605 synthase
MERVQKFLSAAGIASRRKAEEFIKSGQVLINGRKAKLGDKVDPEKDVVKVYGKIIKPGKEKIYLMLNKPKGVVVSKKDPRGRKTVFSLLPDDLRGKVWNVGRLDADTEGLLILTNDGELTQELSHPKFEHEKEYEVETDAAPTETQLDKLRQGVQIATGQTYPTKVRLMHPHPAFDELRSPSPLDASGRGKIEAHCVRITLHEGKKRQIRRMFVAVGLGVKNLKRVRINKLVLPANLAVGQFRIIGKDMII